MQYVFCNLSQNPSGDALSLRTLGGLPLLMRLWQSPCQRTCLRCNSVYDVSASYFQVMTRLLGHAYYHVLNTFLSQMLLLTWHLLLSCLKARRGRLSICQQPACWQLWTVYMPRLCTVDFTMPCISAAGPARLCPTSSSTNATTAFAAPAVAAAAPVTVFDHGIQHLQLACHCRLSCHSIHTAAA